MSDPNTFPRDEVLDEAFRALGESVVEARMLRFELGRFHAMTEVVPDNFVDQIFESGKQAENVEEPAD